MGGIVYFSTKSENTHRFVGKLGLEAARIPLRADDEFKATKPYVLIIPTYSGNDGRGAVPKRVIRFLNDADNRSLLRGVIAAGNTNFGESYGLAGKIVAAKCGVPFLYRFELLGTQDDVDNVRNGLARLWNR